MLTAVKQDFCKRFGDGASLYASPGRINLIGEHTDYNLGFVLPAAIDKSIYVASKSTQGALSRIYAIDFDSYIEHDLYNGDLPEPLWARYLYGVVQQIKKRGITVPAVQCVVGGDLPYGAGISSSAALESVFGFMLNDMFDFNLSRMDLAHIGQMTEHNYVSVMCGIMDQAASMLGERDKVIRLDCRSLEYELFPFAPDRYNIVLIDSMVKHSLASTEYNVRRKQCEQGVRIIAAGESGVESLRDVTSDMLEKYRSQMEATIYNRCRFVIDENARVVDGCNDLIHGDYAAFGRKMFASHDGLNLRYEVSCTELNFIEDIARTTDGVIGARMMGGGFGGCVISLVDKHKCETYVENVKDRFLHKFNVIPRTIDVVIGDGARRIE